MKFSKNAFLSTEDCKQVLRDITLLTNLKHDNVVETYEILPTDDWTGIYYIVEFCDTDLLKVCRNPRGVSLAEARRLSYNVIVGCGFLHSRSIYHRDLKPGNCLANRDCSVKIADFGLARPAPLVLKRSLSNVGTEPYKPPEVKLGLSYTEKFDVWSVGCISAELFFALTPAGRRPSWRELFAGRTLHDVFRMVAHPNDDISRIEGLHLQLRGCSAIVDEHLTWMYKFLPSQAGKDGRALVQDLLRFFQEDRPSMSVALRHEFFKRTKSSPKEYDNAEQLQLSLGYEKSEFGHKSEFMQSIKQQLREARVRPQWVPVS